ncbi:DNA polymerase III subunit gamma/tau [Barnesiella viscericola DSM 18177]|uniref:DNA polymerase III subunit gamma/tau n=1 Tax=Barnesiella viscericola DSM 18177 TaxID=880074 RepID=W0ENJ6_9BACT|nr:DNA polymerase III subunit gamma/tau [Barnesiella viscericola]AHF12400.1 DNA polymerase III subunit gamma/tau [Barnesiella viscericola DSM 18177]
MDNYIVSARKYRPSTFRSVVGQKALTQTLKNAIDSKKLAHAYLFCGPRGVGKTSCARIFAKTINCFHPTESGEACNECESCRAFNEQRSYNIIELDAASNNSVDDIRTLIDQVRIPPQVGQYKVFIIDEVHMLSAAAFNAFLKTLEEPPHHAIFILATTEKHKILPTILSRCQVYDFQRITTADIAEHLQYVASQEGITAEPEALDIIAQKADGGMRDALSIFDQVVSFTGGHITYKAVIENLNVLDYEYYFRLVDAFLQGNVPQALLIFKEVRDHGFEGQFFIGGLSRHLRDLLVSKDPSTLPLLEVSASVAQRYGEQAQKCSLAFLYRAMELSNRCDLDYRISNNKQFLVELTLIQICQIIHPVGSTPQEPPLQKINPPTPGNVPQPAPAAQPQPQNRPASQPQAQAPHQPQAQAQPAPQTATAEPQATYRPATIRPTAPTHKPAAAAPAAQSRKAAPVRISIHQKPAEAAPAEQAAAAQAVLDTPFTEEALNTAWLAYTQTIPTEVVLVNTMQSCRPKLLDPRTFVVSVDSQIQVNCINEHFHELMSFLQNALKNNQFSMQLRINQPGEKEIIFSPKDVLKKMIEKNPDIKNLYDTFDLEIA